MSEWGVVCSRRSVEERTSPLSGLPSPPGDLRKRESGVGARGRIPFGGCWLDCEGASTHVAVDGLVVLATSHGFPWLTAHESSVVPNPVSGKKEMVRWHLTPVAGSIRNAYRWLEDKPLVGIIVAASATVAAVFGSRPGRMDAGGTDRRGKPRLVLAWRLSDWGGCRIRRIRSYRSRHGPGGRPVRDEPHVVGTDGDRGFRCLRRNALRGFAVDKWAFQRAGATEREAAAKAVGLGLLEYVVLSIGALFASIALYFRIDGPGSNAMTLLTSLLILPVLAVGVYFTAPARARRLGRLRGGLARRWLAATVTGGATLRRLVLSPREHGAGVVGNVAYWAGDILCLWAALQMVEARISVAALVLAYSGGYVLTRRALPAGGAGVVELALTFALFWMGLPFARTLVAVVIYRLFNFWLPILPALVLMPSIRQLRERFERVETT